MKWVCRLLVVIDRSYLSEKSENESESGSYYE